MATSSSPSQIGANSMPPTKENATLDQNGLISQMVSLQVSELNVVTPPKTAVPRSCLKQESAHYRAKLAPKNYYRSRVTFNPVASVISMPHRNTGVPYLLPDRYIRTKKKDQCDGKAGRPFTRNAIKRRMPRPHTPVTSPDASLSCDEDVADSNQESDSGESTGEEGPFEAAEYIVDMLPCEDKETISNAIKDYCNVQKQCRWRWGEKGKNEDCKNYDHPRKVCDIAKWKGCDEWR